MQLPFGCLWSDSQARDSQEHQRETRMTFNIRTPAERRRQRFNYVLCPSRSSREPAGAGLGHRLEPPTGRLQRGERELQPTEAGGSAWLPAAA